MSVASSANPSIRIFLSLPGRHRFKGRITMETIRDRVAGLDVHRDRVAASVRLVERGRVKRAKRSFSTMAKGVAELSVWLAEHDVTTVVMESTGVYWKSIYYALEGSVDELWLVNAMHVKRVPGRKTDVSDAEWLGDVAAHGMVPRQFRAAAGDPGAA